MRIRYEQNRAGTHVILRLRTDEGLDGIGYVTPLVPWVVMPLRAAVEAFAARVIGQDPMMVERISVSLLGPTARPQFDGLARSAVSVVDTALWDLKAKALAQPLSRLLGAATTRSPPTRAGISGGSTTSIRSHGTEHS